MNDAEGAPPPAPKAPRPGSDSGGETPAGPSFGNMSEHHWSRARAGTNAEALEYYRQRSHAPGVESGGGARNFYCMACDGVIDADAGAERCPHCGVELEGAARRYFNWVEINEPPASDLRALLPVFLLVGLIAAAILGLIVFALVSGGGEAA